MELVTPTRVTRYLTKPVLSLPLPPVTGGRKKSIFGAY
jgi:hypothetical protein